MCGIYVTNIPFSNDEIGSKLQSISFRGPDNLGFERMKEVVLGHLRLSIIDLNAHANQPFTYNNLKIVYNGEIFNFKQIREELIQNGYSFITFSDTEVLLKGYHFWGTDVLHRLNGMFAFAIYDVDENKFFCARDRLGVKPFYYSWKENGEFEICSQLRPLIFKECKVSVEAVSIYLDCGYVPSPFTIIEGVNKLPAGNILEIDLNAKKHTISEYWNLKPVQQSKITYQEAKEQLHQLLIDAVKIRLEADVPIGAFLSGGIDSALVASIAAKISATKINTFTIGFEDPKYDESKVAAEYAKIIGSNHTETICGANDALKMLPKLIKVYDEPFADSSALPSLLLNSITKKYATVALSGDGGDESFIGYHHLLLAEKFRKISFIPFFIRKWLNKLPLHIIFKTRPETIRGILSSKNDDELISKIFTSFDSLQKVENRFWLKKFSNYKILSPFVLQKAADLNIKLWLENDSNVKVDRASMAFQVEVRSPFLDYRIIEFARLLPLSFRYQKGITKLIIRDILSEYIPQEVFNQPKKGFSIPLGDWINNELREDIIKELNNDFLNKVPNLDIKKFKIQMELHFQKRYDYSFNIWKLYILAKWFNEFKL